MRAGKTAIATALGCDVADVSAYQSTWREKRVFDCDGDLYTSRAIGSRAKLPDGFKWEKMTGDDIEFFERRYEIEIFKAIESE